MLKHCFLLKVISSPYHVAEEKLLTIFRHLWEGEELKMVISIDWKPNPSVRPLNGNNSKEENGDAVSMQFDNRQFSYKELKTVTNSFEESIGKGRFGAVYLGYLEDGTSVTITVVSYLNMSKLLGNDVCCLVLLLGICFRYE